MDASDLIKSLQRKPCEEGAVHIWGPDVDRRAKLLIYKAMEGSIFIACGNAGCSGVSVVTNACAFYFAHAAAGAWAPGIPHAL